MHKHTIEQHSDHNRGATLAEFALTLPILLLLIFGIIEFGRLFQSWVTLQNAARTAVRYASTGQYKEDRYDIESIVVCKPDTTAGENLGAMVTQNFSQGRGYSARPIELFEPKGATSEHLYGSWYGNNTGCQPGPDTDQARRDILRLPSIYEEARRGAAGILLEPSRVSPGADSVEDYLYSQFQRPHPDVDQRDWFDVVICSSREKIYDDSLTEIIDLDTGMAVTDPGDVGRFQLVLDDPDYAPAACVLREAPLQAYAGTLPNNALDPWMDAGGAGELVTIVITFNHRLITPIGLADMVTLQAQRSAINESFRVTNAERALGPAGGPSGAVSTPTPVPPSASPEGPPTASETPTQTFTPTGEPTTTPEPFNCDNIDVFFRSVPFQQTRIFIEFANFNHEEAYLLQSEIHWDKSVAPAQFSNMYMAGMSLDSEIYWYGNDSTSPTIASDEGDLLYTPGNTDHFIFVPGGGEKSLWEGLFLDAPNPMFNYFDIYDFSGTSFVFDHPDPTEEDCRIFVYLPPIPTITAEPPGYESPTPTYTPDCASLTLSVEFVNFGLAGDVTLRIINNGPMNAPFTGFNIVWPAMSGVGLDKVVFGGLNALDTPEFGGVGVVMWDSPFGGGDTSPITDSATEPNFLQQVTVPAFSNTLVHLDFVGVAGKLPISPSDLNGSRFDIWCGLPGTPFGGGNGGNGGNGGSIFLSEINTPVPTNQPPPTWTPLAQTNTPTNTPPPALPTNTFTPLPTVPTLTPSNTPPSTNTPTHTPTFDFGGCTSTDGCD